MPDDRRPIFSIGAVARMLGLPAATIRTWEARYGLVVPQRSAGGQRLYSRDQVEQLRFVRREVESGARPGEAHRLLADRIGPGPPARGRPPQRVALAMPGPFAGDLLRQLLERDGFAVVPAGEAPLAVVGVADADGAALCRRLKEQGGRVIALVDGYPGRPTADAVLDLPVGIDELLDAARSLAAQ